MYLYFSLIITIIEKLVYFLKDVKKRKKEWNKIETSMKYHI